MPDPLPSILAQGGWRLRLLAPGLEGNAIAAARPTLDLLLRGAAPGLGFVLLRRQQGGVLCALHRWTSIGLERTALWLPGHGGLPLPTSALAGGLDGEGELLLIAREAALWQRCMLLTERPDADAYLAAA